MARAINSQIKVVELICCNEYPLLVSFAFFLEASSTRKLSMRPFYGKFGAGKWIALWSRPRFLLSAVTMKEFTSVAKLRIR
jgi:hypothetical protein